MADVVVTSFSGETATSGRFFTYVTIRTCWQKTVTKEGTITKRVEWVRTLCWKCRWEQLPWTKKPVKRKRKFCMMAKRSSGSRVEKAVWVTPILKHLPTRHRNIHNRAFRGLKAGK